MECAAFGFAARRLTLASSPRSKQPAPRSVLSLSRLACSAGISKEANAGLSSGYLAMMGITEAVSTRVLTADNRELMIAAVQCGDVQPVADEPEFLILSHFFRNSNQLREGYYYLATLQGALVKAVHFLEGRSVLFARAPLVAVRYADFEAEKVNWLTKIVGSDVDGQGADVISRSDAAK